MFLLSSGRGVPNQLSSQNNAATVHGHNFPEGVEAAGLYAQQFQSQLTLPDEDHPFPSEAARTACEQQFYCNMEDVLNKTLNNDYGALKTNLLSLINIATRVCNN